MKKKVKRIIRRLIASLRPCDRPGLLRAILGHKVRVVSSGHYQLGSDIHFRVNPKGYSLSYHGGDTFDGKPVALAFGRLDDDFASASALGRFSA